MSEVSVLQDQVKKLHIALADLYRNESSYKPKEYESKVYDIEKKLYELNGQLTKQVSTSYEKKEKAIQANLNNLEEIKNEVLGNKQAGRKVEKDSYQTLIFDILLKGKCKSLDEVCDEIDRLRPGREKDKNMEQVKRTIYRVKKKFSARYDIYTWDETKFRLKRRKQ